MPVPEKLEVRVLDAEIFGGCNYKCHFCPQSKGREKEFIRKLPIEVLEKTMDECMDYGLECVTLHGSGEPTLHPQFPAYVVAVKSRGLKCISFTNGFRLTEKLSHALVGAGIDILRISCIGYDSSTYESSMIGGNFDKVRENVLRFAQIAQGTSSEVHFNHLVIDNERVEFEVEQYQKNWSGYIREHVPGAKVHAEVWKMHNWADSDKIEIGYRREERKKRTCGRPFAPLIQMRAGGLERHNGAVVACCMVLGQDSKGVLGHTDTQTISEIVAGDSYEKLRDAHRREAFEEIDVCANCDQLYDTPEALVWCDIPGREYQQSKNSKSLKFSDHIPK
jgi:MoaA/NifB/PqqE/SkfB family radical SAM enzyme